MRAKSTLAKTVCQPAGSLASRITSLQLLFGISFLKSIVCIVDAGFVSGRQPAGLNMTPKKGFERWIFDQTFGCLGFQFHPSHRFLRGTQLSLAFDFSYNTVNSPKRARGSCPSLGWKNGRTQLKTGYVEEVGLASLINLLHTQSIYIYIIYIYIYTYSYLLHNAYNLGTVN